ncbi:MAG: hypothetical protein ABFD98_13230 [Syntrophobacteraceae bacterium]|nr:hypothetical protein [Desulfobacteraceae bacterium]
MFETPAHPIREEIAAARALHESHGAFLSADARIGSLLAGYREAIRRSGDLMRGAGVCAACARCAGVGQGSCCFPGIENEYDCVGLLMNLLLGCNVPGEAAVPGSCFFLGEKGCRLTARYYFCVNYLCPDLQKQMGAENVRTLLHAVGEELSSGWELEQSLRRIPGIGTAGKRP